MYRNIIILGGSYGGAAVAHSLATSLQDVQGNWRIILIDRNTHVNHVYVFPRFAVISGHEHKAFIPYTNIFHLPDSATHPHIVLNTHVIGLTAHSVTLSKAFPELGIPKTEIPFEFAVYALGSHPPSPLNLWDAEPGEVRLQNDPSNSNIYQHVYTGSKVDGINWLKRHQKVVENASHILVVGGGALGIQFATDISSVYDTKSVTLLHSRHRLLPRFNEAMHNEVMKSVDELKVKIILGQRLDMTSIQPGKGKKVVRTEAGTEIETDLILLCTGQRPNTDMLSAMDPTTIEKSGLAHVLRTMQLCPLGVQSKTPYPNIFAIGDCSDAFGAIPAGHTASNQGIVAANNIITLIKNEQNQLNEPLDDYVPGNPAIKVSLGMKKSVTQTFEGTTDVKWDGVDDLRAPSIWPFFGYKVTSDEDLYA